MKRSRYVPIVAAALLGILPVGASGSPVSASNSDVPAIVRVVGATSGVPDVSAGQFKVVARGFDNGPRPNASIVVDFSNCPDVVICASQFDPAVTADCGLKTVRKITNALGEVTFTILGASVGVGRGSPQPHAGRIFGNGILLRSPNVAVYDLDGRGGLGPSDLSAWLTDFASGAAPPRSDYDGDGLLGAADLSMLLSVFAAGTSTESCRTACP